MAVEKEQIREFLDIESSELKNFIDSIDAEALIAARELILQAEQNHNRVHVTGIGKPGHVAGYAASLLSSTGTPTYELHGTEAVHGSAGQVLSGDVVIAISNSGDYRAEGNCRYTEKQWCQADCSNRKGRFLAGKAGGRHPDRRCQSGGGCYEQAA